jgi:hypothetical protein
MEYKQNGSKSSNAPDLNIRYIHFTFQYILLQNEKTTCTQIVVK